MYAAIKTVPMVKYATALRLGTAETEAILGTFP
jgi:hypothetical protein